MSLYRGMTADDLEKQYNLRGRRPDFDDVVAAWLERSAALRKAYGARADVVYGAGERERFDFFPARKPAGDLLIYIHGGYWQRGDKAMYSFIAEPFLENGVAVAVLNYNLCPSVRLGEIAPQIRRAIGVLHGSAGELGFDNNRIFVMGHSAGGHLTAMMMATDWPALDSALPADLIKGGVPISALFELEPLVHTSINDGPRMDVEEALRESPMFMAPATDAPQLVVVGGAETPEFHRQSDDYCAKFRTAARHIERYSVPDADHFDELNRLAEADSEFFRRSLRLIRHG